MSFLFLPRKLKGQINQSREISGLGLYFDRVLFGQIFVSVLLLNSCETKSVHRYNEPDEARAGVGSSGEFGRSSGGPNSPSSNQKHPDPLSQITDPVTTSTQVPNGGAPLGEPMPGAGAAGTPAPGATNQTTAGGAQAGVGGVTGLPSPGGATGASVPLNRTKLPKAPRIGVILGAGGLKTFAHIGFLQQLNRFKISLSGIVGIEMAAPIAALYAQKEGANQVEWQMFKLKEDSVVSKGFLSDGHKSLDFGSMGDFLTQVFGQTRSEDLRIPFACPAFNLSKGLNFLMNKGHLVQLIELCTPYPPMFRPHKKNMAGVREIKTSVDFLKGRGANFIILVNVLDNPMTQSILGKGSGEDFASLLWSEISANYAKSANGIAFGGVDFILNISTAGYSLVDYESRRDLMLRGAQISEKAVADLARKLGL